MGFLSSLLSGFLGLLQPMLEQLLQTELGRQLLMFLLSLMSQLPPGLVEFLNNLLGMLGLG